MNSNENNVEVSTHKAPASKTTNFLSILDKVELNTMLKGFGVILITGLISFGTVKLYQPKQDTPKLVKVNILKINQDYTTKAVNLVLNLNQNNANITQEQRNSKAQAVMRIVGQSTQETMDDYSLKNKVVIIQAQALGSDAYAPLPDITNEIESQIDARINKDNLYNAAQQ
jgi:hypothetical protein